MAAETYQAYESEYELQRRKRIKENNEMMRQIFGNTLTEHFPPDLTKTKRTPRAKSCSPYAVRNKEVLTPLRRNPKRSARSYHSEDVEVLDEDSDDEIPTENKLVVRWVGPLTKKRRISGN